MRRLQEWRPSPKGGKTPVLLYGLGAIGRRAAREALRCPDFTVMGAVDVDPEVVGRSLAEILEDQASGDPGAERGAGPWDAGAARVRVARQVPGAPRGAVALHMAGSRLADIEPQLAELIGAGYSIVSSAEELVWPALRHADIAARLDALAKERRVAVVGAGVNPGFVMDVLPAVAATVCRDIRCVEVERVVNASLRRAPLQRKIGSGLTPVEFERLASAGRVGHVGLAESCAFLLSAVGLEADRMEEDLSPLLADGDIETAHVRVARGLVRGIRHVVRALRGGEPRVVLRLVMALSEPEPHDEIRIEARPPLLLRIEGGTPGDAATVAALLNAVPRVAAAPPGLHTMLSLPLRPETPSGLGA